MTSRALGRFFATVHYCVVLIPYCVSRLWTPTLEFGTILGIAYLIYDTYYQTEATVSSPASDPRDPFYFPFAFTNNSHIFYLKEVNWDCTLPMMITEGENTVANSAIVVSGVQNEIAPGQTLNLLCRGIKVDAAAKQATLVIETSYKTRIFAIDVRQRPVRTTFTWAGGASTPQWIKGDFPSR